MNNSRTDHRQMYTLKEVAGLLKVNVKTVSRLVNTGQLVACSFGYKTLRIPAHQIDKLIEERTLGGM